MVSPAPAHPLIITPSIPTLFAHAQTNSAHQAPLSINPKVLLTKEPVSPS